jgi:hypothetical protein
MTAPPLEPPPAYDTINSETHQDVAPPCKFPLPIYEELIKAICFIAYVNDRPETLIHA